MSKLEALHGDLADRLAAMESLFSVPTKITLLIRTPTLADGGVFISNDEKGKIISEIERLTGKQPLGVTVRS